MHEPEGLPKRGAGSLPSLPAGMACAGRGPPRHAPGQPPGVRAMHAGQFRLPHPVSRARGIGGQRRAGGLPARAHRRRQDGDRWPCHRPRQARIAAGRTQPDRVAGAHRCHPHANPARAENPRRAALHRTAHLVWRCRRAGHRRGAGGAALGAGWPRHHHRGHHAGVQTGRYRTAGGVSRQRCADGAFSRHRRQQLVAGGSTGAAAAIHRGG